MELRDVLLASVVLFALTAGTPAASAGALARGSESAGAFSVSLSATPSYGESPLAVVFQSSVSSGVPTYYAWTFGDGSSLNGTNASYADPEHVYATAGTYLAVLNVSEGSLSASGSIPIHVVVPSLTVTVSAQPTRGVEPLTVTFRANVTGGTGTYLSVNWSFGDGSSGSGFVVQYTYERAGDFFVTVQAQDSAHASASAGTWVNLTAPAADGPVPDGAIEVWAIVGFVLGVIVTVAVVVARLRWSAREPVRVEPASPDVERPDVPTPVVAPSSSPAPADESPVDPASAPSPEPPVVRLSHRIVVHLAGQGTLSAYDVAPIGRTQAGMASALGVRQNALTNVLRRLAAAGVVEVDLRHVVGQPRRLKVYRLTPRGELLARELRLRRPPS